jgi:two-component system, OmpR family, response regulator CpxR
MESSGRKLILVVDNNSETRESVRDLLEFYGYIVECAQNGRDALNHIKAAQMPPALILLDLTMPVMDGRAFLACARKHESARETPIVVITGETDPQAPGATEILTKPVKSNRLLSLVERFAN